MLFLALMFLFVSLRLLSGFPHSRWWRFIVGWVWGFTFFAPQLTWLTVPADSVAPWLALTGGESLFIAAFALVWSTGEDLLRHRARIFWPFRLLWAPLAWVGVEQLRAVFPFGGFPWSKLAFALVDSPLSAWAPWGGSVAVGVAVVLISVGVIEVFWHSPGFLRRPICLVLVIAVVVFPMVEPVSKPQMSGYSLRVAVIQGNTPVHEPRFAYGAPFQVLNMHVAESERLHSSLTRGEGVDLVLWPENAADVDPRLSGYAADQVNRVSAVFHAPIIFGTLAFNAKGIKNTVVYWRNYGARGEYSKQHLVPFGEYLPWRRLITALMPKLAALVPQDIHPGNSVAQLRIRAGSRWVRVATPICFEIADDALVRNAADGAAFLVVPSSNTLFGNSSQAAQQLAIARFRALEHGLDTVQVSTMNSTARINAEGKIVGRVIPVFKSGSFVSVIPLRDGATPATRWGKNVSFMVVGLFCLFVLLIAIVSLKESWRK